MARLPFSRDNMPSFHVLNLLQTRGTIQPGGRTTNNRIEGIHGVLQFRLHMEGSFSVNRGNND